MVTSASLTPTLFLTSMRKISLFLLRWQMSLLTALFTSQKQAWLIFLTILIGYNNAHPTTLSTTPHYRTNHGACTYARNRSIHYRDWHEPIVYTLHTTRSKYRMVPKPTNDWGLLRPRLHEVRAINCAYGIEFALYYGCYVLQHTRICSNSCLRWHLFSHQKGSQPWPITTCVTHTISANPGLNACSLWPGTVGWALGRVSAHKRSVCRVSEANRTLVRTNVRDNQRWTFNTQPREHQPEQTFDKSLALQ